MIIISKEVLNDIIDLKINEDKLEKKVSQLLKMDKSAILEFLSNDKKINVTDTKNDGQRIFIQGSGGELHYNKMCSLIECLCSVFKLRNADLKNKTVAQKLAISRELASLDSKVESILNSNGVSVLISTDVYFIDQDMVYTTLPVLGLFSLEKRKRLQFSVVTTSNEMSSNLSEQLKQDYYLIEFKKISISTSDIDRLRVIIANRKQLLTGMSVLNNLFIEEYSYDLMGLMQSVGHMVSYLTSLANVFPDNGDKIRRSEFVNSFSDLLKLTIMDKDNIDYESIGMFDVSNNIENIIANGNDSDIMRSFSTISDLDILSFVILRDDISIRLDSREYAVLDNVVTGKSVKIKLVSSNNNLITFLSSLNSDSKDLIRSNLRILLLLSLKAILFKNNQGKMTASINNNVIKEILYGIRH